MRWFSVLVVLGALALAVPTPASVRLTSQDSLDGAETTDALVVGSPRPHRRR